MVDMFPKSRKVLAIFYRYNLVPEQTSIIILWGDFNDIEMLKFLTGKVPPNPSKRDRKEYDRV